MGYQKDREVFNLGGFKGLDTENAKIKLRLFAQLMEKTFKLTPIL